MTARMTFAELRKSLEQTRDAALWARINARKMSETSEEYRAEANALYNTLLDTYQELSNYIWNLEDMEEANDS